MRKYLALAAALALLSPPVLAQEALKSPDLDRQVEQTQLRMHAAQAEHYLALARKIQAEALDGAKREAAKDAWWAAWWRGMYPDKTVPAVSAAPQAAPAQ